MEKMEKMEKVEARSNFGVEKESFGLIHLKSKFDPYSFARGGG